MPPSHVRELARVRLGGACAGRSRTCRRSSDTPISAPPSVTRTSRRVPWRRPPPARTSPTSAVTPPSRLLSPLVQLLETLGAPGRIRTCDLRLRRPSLYPAELRARTTSDSRRCVTRMGGQLDGLRCPLAVELVDARVSCSPELRGPQERGVMPCVTVAHRHLGRASYD